MANHYTNKKSHHRHGAEDNHSITRDSIISTAFDLFREKAMPRLPLANLPVVSIWILRRYIITSPQKKHF